MKKLHFIISIFVFTILLGCSSDDSNIDLDGLSAPANISVLTTVTQDNSGKVTFLPTGEGVTQYKISYGDGTSESVYFSAGATITHTYKEGIYKAKIVAMGISGKTTEINKDIIVSFNSPANLVVVITNDVSVSKKITVKATADFALFYDVYFGEAGKPEPVSVNNGESVSYTYKEAGVYTVRVVSKSAAIKTVEHTEQITAKLIVNPTASAPVPPIRLDANVISIYSSKYKDVEGTNFNPNWGQSGSLSEFELAGDKMLNYTNLNYQGIAFADGVKLDVSKMDYIHLDVWTADLEKLAIFLISSTKINGERPVTKDLVANQWTSIDIPISAFTSQDGFTVADIFQLKLVGTPDGKNIYLDNIYFYKLPAESVALPLDFESANLTFGWGGFGTVDASIATNPDKTGANVSDKVVKIDKKTGAETWGGASLNLESVPDFSKGTKVKVNVWSPRTGVDILYKMEVSTSPKDGNGNPTVFIEVHATTTVANAWNVLTFDLTSAASFSTSNKYDRVILFPDFGKSGTGETYYFDDIKQSN